MIECKKSSILTPVERVIKLTLMPVGIMNDKSDWKAVPLALFLIVTSNLALFLPSRNSLKIQKVCKIRVKSEKA